MRICADYSAGGSLCTILGAALEFKKQQGWPDLQVSMDEKYPGADKLIDLLEVRCWLT